MATLDHLRVSGVSLALGGGGARGIAHLGVLKVLAEERIRVRCVAGTSAGSLVGALLCTGRDWRWMLEAVRRLQWSDLVAPVVPRMGLLSTERLERYLERSLGSVRIEDLPLPFVAVAVDITTGAQVILRSGPVASAVRASCSVPGIFEPVDLDGRLLVDGGLLNDVPADVARTLGGGPVLAVNLNGGVRREHRPRTIFDVISGSLAVLALHGIQQGLAGADIVVSPDLGGTGYHDLRRVDELVATAESAARTALAEAGRAP